MAGRSVALLCSGRANPPATNYTWYKDGVKDKESGQTLVIPAVNLSHSGSYYCEAKNDLGEERSTTIQLDVQCKWTTMKTVCFQRFIYGPAVGTWRRTGPKTLPYRNVWAVDSKPLSWCVTNCFLSTGQTWELCCLSSVLIDAQMFCLVCVIITTSCPTTKKKRTSGLSVLQAQPIIENDIYWI